MLLSLHRVFRHRRRSAASLLAGLTLAFATLAAHTTLMSSQMSMGHHHDVADSGALCLAIGGCALFIAVATVAAAWPRRRRLWLASAPLAPSRAFVATPAAFRVRAGPLPPVLQVFRL